MLLNYNNYVRNKNVNLGESANPTWSSIFQNNVYLMIWIIIIDTLRVSHILMLKLVKAV